MVNADDFGFTRDVNQGIIEAHRQGILTATTLMANGDAFEDAVRTASENPSLDIGAHLVLIGGRSLAEADRALPSSVPRLLAAIAARRLNVYEELAAQSGGCGGHSICQSRRRARERLGVNERRAGAWRSFAAVFTVF